MAQSKNLYFIKKIQFNFFSKEECYVVVDLKRKKFAFQLMQKVLCSAQCNKTQYGATALS